VQILQEQKSACLRGRSRHPAFRGTCASLHIVHPDRHATGISMKDIGLAPWPLPASCLPQHLCILVHRSPTELQAHFNQTIVTVLSNAKAALGAAFDFQRYTF